MTKQQYDQQPDILLPVGDGSYRYRWAIAQAEREDHFTGNKTIYWECLEVTVWNEPTRQKVTEAVIAAMWPPTVEAKLINDYNAANEGLLPVEAKLPYTDFIVERNILKNEIKQYFASR